jgi:prevent-host-death family protein
MGIWQLQEAKARLSEVVKKATKEGPQKITVHGEPTAVVISSEEYERLKHHLVRFPSRTVCSSESISFRNFSYWLSPRKHRQGTGRWF